MTGPVIITRAEPGASDTEARLTELGYETRKLPALSIIWSHTNIASTDPSHDACYIFTSANGVRAIKHFGWPVSFPAVCVGPATLAAAEAAGFGDLHNADGNADDLVELICSRFSTESAPRFIHVANKDAAGDVVRRLGEAGFQAEFAPLYETRPTRWTDIRSSWPLASGDAVILIHSAKGATAVSRWIEDGVLSPKSLSIVGVSEKSIVPLKPERFKQMAVALRPNENELIKALQSLPEPGVSSGK